MAFTLYKVDAIYHADYWTNFAIGYSCVCDSAAEANSVKLRYEADPKVEKVTTQANHYGR